MASLLLRFLPMVAFLATSSPSPAQTISNVRLDIIIRDLPADSKSIEQQIRENILVAAEMWIGEIVAKPVSIELELIFKTWPNRGAGRSLTAVRLAGEKINGKPVLEEGMPHELRTGRDPNGSAPDVEIVLDPEYAKTMWWDPTPRSRTLPVPNDKLDALSVIAHELGHAIGFNGRLDPKRGEPTGEEVSTYDRWVQFDPAAGFTFTGPAATKVYEKKIPLSRTITNYHHFGEPGSDLDPQLKKDLMNGIVMEYGKRYRVSPLDLAILADCGLELRH